MVTSLWDPAGGETGFCAGETLSDSDCCDDSREKTQKITADVGKRPQACHTNVPINRAKVFGIVEKSKSTP